MTPCPIGHIWLAATNQRSIILFIHKGLTSLQDMALALQSLPRNRLEYVYKRRS